MTYEFRCPDCHSITEIVSTVADRPKSIDCACGGKALRILSLNGGIETDCDVKWLPSACQTLQREGERPLETRTQYKQYLTENNLTCKG